MRLGIFLLSISMLLAVVLSVENDNSGLRDIDSINKQETPVEKQPASEFNYDEDDSLYDDEEDEEDFYYDDARAGCKDRLPSKMRSDSNCKALEKTCSNLKNKCTSKLGSALGSSKLWRVRKCKTALGNNKDKKVQRFCKLACKKCANGKWSKWGSYGACSVSCGGGTKTRRRTCNNPKPFGGGDSCPGSSTSSTTCNNKECPRNGVWGSWESWGSCSLTCGNGTQSRTRACNSPPPNETGQFCLGDDTEYRLCNEEQCDVPCVTKDDCTFPKQFCNNGTCALCDIGMFDCNDPDYNFYCLADFLKCDGVDHCPNKNDEKDCPATTESPPTTPSIPIAPCVTNDDCPVAKQFCNNGTCSACDIGWFDCNDANYEYYCIKNFLQCDGIDNCPNKNDEKDCPAITESPPTTGTPIDSTYIVTNNNGGCCVSDYVSHDFCLITNLNATDSPAQELGFELSQCEQRCSNDPFCKGYTKLTSSYNVSMPPFPPLIIPPHDYCFLFTNSSTSGACTHNTNGSGSEIGSDFTIASGPLDPNAICSVSIEFPGVSENYYEGCHIKTKDVQEPCTDDNSCRFIKPLDCDYHSDIQELCPNKCGVCNKVATTKQPPCDDVQSSSWCRLNKRRCNSESLVRSNCRLTCGLCHP